MKTKYIITQDKDQIIPLANTTYLMPVPVMHNDVCIAYNVMTAVSLGTFDDLSAAVAEINKIVNCGSEIYVVDEGD